MKWVAAAKMLESNIIQAQAKLYEVVGDSWRVMRALI